MVLLPGLNGTVGLFAPLIAVSNNEYATLAIAYPSHEKKSYAELTALVEQHLSQLEGRYILIGESFSGAIAIAITAKNLHGHIGTVLVATFCSAPNIKIAKYLPWTLAFYCSKPLYWLRVKLSSSKNKGLSKSTAVEMQKVAPEILANRMQSIFEFNVETELEQCTLPITYFRGDFDFIVPKWNLSQMLRLNSKITTVHFPTQHFLLQSAPQQAWYAITAFIKKYT